MSKLFKLLFACLLITACNQDQRTYNFTIVTNDGNINYKLKKAQSSSELEKGLMNVDFLPDDEGMIFDLRNYQDIAMWMKDTKIPLDMIFADNEGEVIWLFENAEPLSEDFIVPPVDVSFVVEVNGGQIAKYKVKIGDKLKHELFNNFEKAKERFEAKAKAEKEKLTETKTEKI